MKKIILVEDHPLMIKAMQIVLENSFPEYAVVVALSAAEMRRSLNEDGDNNSFSLAIIDFCLHDKSGLNIIEELRVQYDIPVIVMTGQFDYQTFHDCQQQGASGILQKISKIENIVTTIKIVLLGGQFFPRMQAEQDAYTKQSIFKSLTQRQQQVLDLVVDGRPNKYIAAKLGIGEGHVRNMVSQLFDNFSVTGRSRTHLSSIVSKLRVAPKDSQRPN